MMRQARKKCHYAERVTAFFIYLILSFLFFGRGLIGHLSDRYVGMGTDPGFFVFCLEWWKYAFSHQVNPFLTRLQWAPSGANLTWSTFIPLFGISAIPLTDALGPIASLNLLVVLCPALAAWTAYLLCRYLSPSFFAALVGGYIFGFSPSMMCHLLGHLTVLLIFPVPLMVLVVLRRLRGEIGVLAFAVAFAVLIITLFLCWLEAVATTALFGSAAIVIAWLNAPQWRRRLEALILPVACAYAASAVILTPYLYYFFAFGQPAFPGGMRQLVSVQPLSFLVPSPVNLLGCLPRLRELSSGHIYENGAYLALPILFIVTSFAHSHWQEWPVRMAVFTLAIICIASLGSPLVIGRHAFRMPWGAVARMPLMDKALPGRFMIFSFLICGIILSMWLSELAIPIRSRVLGACAVLLFSLPNPSSAFWTTAINTPEFFAKKEFSQYLKAGDNVLILPYGLFGNSNIWQATNEFYYRMAGGYVGQPPIPPEYLPFFPIVYDFFNLADSPLAGELLKIFLVQKDVSAIIVADQGEQLWRNSLKSGTLRPEATALNSEERTVLLSLFATLKVNPLRIGGVSFYRVPLERMDAYRHMDPSALVARIVAIQLDTLIYAAAQYLSNGRPMSELNPLEVQRLGLLPPRWICGTGIIDKSASFQNGMLLEATTTGTVVVGVISTPAILHNLSKAYREYAQKVEIWPLIKVSGFAESEQSILLIECNKLQLFKLSNTIHLPNWQSADWMRRQPSIP